MISVISLNEKFKSITPNAMIKKLVESKYTKGVEICASPNDEEMLAYMDELVKECKENNILFQVHGDSSLDLETQLKYLERIAEYSDYLGYTINVVLHSVLRDDNETSLHDSQEYFDEILKIIDRKKIRISVENLNDAVGYIRLNKDEMKPILYNDARLYMTYDIGHEIADFGNITDIDPEFIKRLSNVHLHEISDRYKIQSEHLPIYDTSKDFEQVLKGILFLKKIKYEGPVVFEYDLYACKGETIEEKVDEYIHSIDSTSEHMI
jgi:sugar phosphate isomerase/epimerase